MHMHDFHLSPCRGATRDLHRGVSDGELIMAFGVGCGRGYRNPLYDIVSVIKVTDASATGVPSAVNSPVMVTSRPTTCRWGAAAAVMAVGVVT
jgi:hypothetical protein